MNNPAVVLLTCVAVAASGCPWDMWIAGTDGANPAGGLPGIPAEACNDAGWCWQRPAQPGHLFTAIDGTGNDDIWAVGQHGYVAHYDGIAWAQRYLQPEVDWNLVRVVRPREIFLAGCYAEPIPPLGCAQPTALHVVGDDVEELTIDGMAPDFFFGSSPDDTWASTQLAVYRQAADGSWVFMLAQADGGNGANGWARAPDDVFVTFKNINEMWHFDGHTWEQQWPLAGAPVGAYPPSVGDVAPDGTLFVHAMGDPTTQGDGYTARYDGTWTFWPRPLLREDHRPRRRGPRPRVPLRHLPFRRSPRIGR
jgi:hypothetical protein